MHSQEVDNLDHSPRQANPLSGPRPAPLEQRLVILSAVETPFWVFDIDNLSIVWANESAMRLWEAETLAELYDRDLSESTSLAATRRLRQFQEDFKRQKTFSESWTIHPKSHPVTSLMHCSGIELDDGRMAMLVEAQPEANSRDSDTMRSTQALLHTPVMVSLFKTNGQLLYCNPAAREMLGPDCDYLQEHFCEQSDLQTIFNRLKTEQEFSTECCVKTHHGAAWHRLSIQLSYDNMSGQETILISEMDITKRRAAEKRVQSLAYRDPLTGLPNRTFLNEKVDHFIDVAQKYQTKFAMLFIDLDRFKLINDSLGHGVGDALLKQASRLLQSSLRRSDTLVRLGGDEFVVVMHHLPEPSAAESLAIRLLDTMKDPVCILGHELRLSASVGISVYPEDGDESEILMKNADLAMYQAKDEGGNCIKRFNPSMGLDLINRLQLEVDLRRAINRGEFELHYQPRVCSRTDQIVSAEALIRWNHPQRGLVSPAEFIPLAEETGMIVDIGNWVLEEAVNTCSAWHDQGFEFGVSVNVSSRQLNSDQFVDRVLNTLRHAHCPAYKLELELTESMLVSETSTVLETLNALQDTGVQISIDDFGTGYSNLAYLKDFPIDKLKIDRSFVMDSEQHALVEMIVSLGKMLDVKVVAEGIETEEQCRWLKTLDCAEFQGYFFSKPLSRVKFEKYHLQSRKNSRREQRSAATVD